MHRKILLATLFLKKGFRDSEETILCMFGPIRNRTLPPNGEGRADHSAAPKKAGFSGVSFSNGSQEEDLVASMQ